MWAQKLRQRKKLFAACMLLISTCIVFYIQEVSAQIWKILPIPSPAFVRERRCEHVLDKLVKGRWVQGPYTEAEMNSLQNFLHKARDKQGLPRSLQRKDNKCGNIAVELFFKPTAGAVGFRALCDPFGPVPCCFNNQCVAKSMKNCRCPLCYDLRQQIHAEFSTWIPTDSDCRMEYLTDPEVLCDLLHGMTIVFFGDSFMRHLYQAVLGFIRGGDTKKVLRDDLNPDLAAECSDKYYLYATACRNAIPMTVTECNNTVRLRMVQISKVAELHSSNLAKSLMKTPNSLFVLGMGVHDNYQEKVVVKQILEPMLDVLSKSSNSKIFWIAPHAPGLLKSPLAPHQLGPNVLRYNTKMSVFLRKHNIPIFDFFNMTKGLMSHDGLHFGKGVNDLKAQIIFHYLRELKLVANKKN